MANESMAQGGGTRVIVGVDTHKDVHVARAKDELGRALGELSIPASSKGYRALLAWSRGFGDPAQPPGPPAPGEVRSRRRRRRLGRALRRGEWRSQGR